MLKAPCPEKPLSPRKAETVDHTGPYLQEIMRFFRFFLGLPKWLSGKESAGSAGGARDNEFDPCLGQNDPLEKEMATHSSILIW